MRSKVVTLPVPAAVDRKTRTEVFFAWKAKVLTKIRDNKYIHKNVFFFYRDSFTTNVMSYALLKNNIESLIEQNGYKVAKVEELAGLNQGNVSNILSGRSKKPSAEILLSIARVFGVTVEELLQSKTITPSKYLSSKELGLFLDIARYLNDTIIDLQIKVYYKDFVSMINEIFEYSQSTQDYELDTKFINWYIKQKFPST